ncbi:hypothetical protein GBAR_LOCUS16551 [Geodia barretti]|uniref:Secreted protein n=1 Tax=Geodia barretti TaxID=519541 RepID=A0AA35SFE8_GEOBA|nr:hypothetical protein GBAR_LOCUS16551 [Geodia barretti]
MHKSSIWSEMASSSILHLIMCPTVALSSGIWSGDRSRLQTTRPETQHDERRERYGRATDVKPPPGGLRQNV